MIMYKKIASSHSWSKLPRYYANPRKEDFKYMKFMIQGTTYTEWSPKFINAYNKELIWERLKQ